MQAACPATARTVHTRHEVEQARVDRSYRHQAETGKARRQGQGSSGQEPGEPPPTRGAQLSVLGGGRQTSAAPVLELVAASFVPALLPRSCKSSYAVTTPLECLKQGYRTTEGPSQSPLF